MKRGFTLVEVLVAGVVLAIGFSALAYWYMGNGVMIRRDRSRVEALHILENEAELRFAHPEQLHDSEWTINVGFDTFALKVTVLDSAKLRHIADTSLMSSAEADQFVHRPREVRLGIQAKPPVAPYSNELFFLVGGVMHVAP